MIFIYIIIFALLFRVSAELAFAALAVGIGWIVFKYKQGSEQREQVEREATVSRQEEAQKRYQNALTAAQSGDTKAQYEFALRLLHGHDCEANPAMALEWFARCVETGSAEAMALCGELLLDGLHGLPVDRENAMDLLSTAAGLGHEGAARRVLKEHELREAQLEDERWRGVCCVDKTEWPRVKALLDRCESPPERLLMTALIREAELKPNGDQLCSAQLTIAPQRSVLRYRVDFLVNTWLVVEVDGKEYHNTARAFETDRERDQNLMLANYRPVRFSAQQVFTDPVGVAKKIIQLAAQTPQMPAAPATSSHGAGPADAGTASRSASAAKKIIARTAEPLLVAHQPSAKSATLPAVRLSCPEPRAVAVIGQAPPKPSVQQIAARNRAWVQDYEQLSTEELERVWSERDILETMEADVVRVILRRRKGIAPAANAPVDVCRRCYMPRTSCVCEVG